MAEIIQTTGILTSQDRWDHILACCGVRRSQHRVQPGLYALGNNPDRESLVFVSANYTLSFDALRSALLGRDAYILVLDTRGVNVWCAAGEGTFGTEELVSRIESTGLEKIVDHRSLILPQLGATGISAHLVKHRCGFEVEYGPVRAEDLPQYLNEHRATPQMRRVRFNLIDRLTLVPVEVVNSLLPMAIIAGLLFLLGGWFNVLWVLSAWLACTVIFFILLPWIPAREFSIKGLILGAVVAVPFIIYQFTQTDGSILQNLMQVAPMALIITAIVSFFTLNQTGTTPITCWTSVKREIARYIPIQASMAGAGIIMIILRLFGIGR
jgi:hypothetical protein